VIQSAVATIRISESFLSLQGEGPSIGQPAHFLRLQGCSVGCRWCDTRYSWDSSAGSDESLNAVEQRLRTLGQADLLVLTGGEPLEHPQVDVVLSWAASSWARVEVETSGFCPPPKADTNVSWNWSPKLSSVTPHSARTWIYADRFLDRTASVCKLVIDNEEDWAESLALIQKHKIPANRVYVVPQGLRQSEVETRAKWLAPRCIERGFRLSFRLHVLLWGGRRGV
jgi:organic radical activating enzyme